MNKIIAGLVFVLMAHTASAAVIDAPHNSITCSTCHNYSLWWQYSPSSLSPAPNDHTAIVDAVCITCHKDGAGGLPIASTHSSTVINSNLHGTWGVGCTDCHNPHFQDQLNWLGAADGLFLVTGTITAVSNDSSLNQATISYTNATENLKWPAVGDLDTDLDWSNKSLANPDRGLIMVHDTSNALNTFPIISATANEVVVKGTISPNDIDPDFINPLTHVQNSATCNTFGLIYGQLINAWITRASKPVKFFDPTGGFTEENADPAGICQVCHTDTHYWLTDGSLATHHSGETCTSCHAHNQGFAGAPNNGKHPLHVTTDEIPCSSCHNLSALHDGSGNVLFKDGQTLDSTTVCAACHQDGESGSPAQTDYKTGWLDSGYHLTCTSCHGFPPSYSNGSPKANSHQRHGDFTCDKCHAATTTNGTSITTTANHANGTYDLLAGDGISFSFASDPDGGNCATVSCHGDTAAQWGTANCLGCHTVAQGNRAPIGPQFSSNSHHVQGAALTSQHCYQCHWEANDNGSINPTYHGGSANPGAAVDLVIYGAGSRPTTYTVASTAIQYTANGSRSEIAELNSHCLGCHSDQNNGSQPFGDGKTPKQYAWDGNSVNARYSQAGTTAWGKYSGAGVTPKDTRTKAYSAHGNAVANQGGWDLAETWPNTRGGAVNVACYDCHNSHGSTVAGTTTSYTSATASGGLLKDTTLGGGGYTVAYKPVTGGTTEDKNIRNPGASLCFDCHLTADGAAVTPWGYQATFGESQAILGYFDAGFLAPGASGAQQRYAYKGLSINAGGHFGASSALGSAPMHNIGGLCTPCHDPHGVSPTDVGTCSNGSDVTKSTCQTNGGVWSATPQFGVPMLKGTWMTSPYKDDVAPANNALGTVRDSTYPLGHDNAPREGVQYHIDQNTFGANIRAVVAGVTQTANQFAGLCLNCHAKSNLTNGTNGGTWKGVDRIHESVKGWGANVKHNYTCSKCHTPHIGSALPRLMITNCLNNAHKGRVNHNPSPVLSGSGICSGSCDSVAQTIGLGGMYELYPDGSGGGHFPGSWSGNNPGDLSVTCHENNAADQSWNSVTPW